MVSFTWVQMYTGLQMLSHWSTDLVAANICLSCAEGADLLCQDL